MAAHNLSTGEIPTEEGQTVDAGPAGKYTVGQDGEVQYDKPLNFPP